MIGRMKLAILGGGGFRVPHVYRALLDESLVTEVVLCDPSAERLAVIETVLAQQAREASDAPRVSSTSELAVALLGAHFVFSAIRAGGLAARTLDERIPLRLGVLGQETTGPGAVAYGLRTLPVAMEIAQQVRAWCPEAYVINFTNPAGMITEAMQRVLGSRVIGVCDTPSDLVRRIGLGLGVDPTGIQPDYVGLNHLGWLRRVLLDGIDVLPALLADEARVGVLDEAAIFGIPWLRAMRSVPNEYLYYYYFTRDAIRSILSVGATRGEFLERQQAEFYRAAANSPGDALALWERASSERSAWYMAEAKGGAASSAGYAGGYEQVALAVVSAIARDEAATLILDVRNGPALPGMDADAVVELPTVVDRRGVHPLPTATPTLHQLGLMQQVKAVERLTIEAATTGSRDAALEALALHPLVDSVSVARDLLSGYISAIPEVAAVLTRP
jgi:6-phospho-beta-glucosidase